MRVWYIAYTIAQLRLSLTFTSVRWRFNVCLFKSYSICWRERNEIKGNEETRRRKVDNSSGEGCQKMIPFKMPSLETNKRDATVTISFVRMSRKTQRKGSSISNMKARKKNEFDIFPNPDPKGIAYKFHSSMLTKHSV